MLTLTLEEIFKFVKSNEKSRNIREGQKILSSKNLIRCGITSKSSNQVHVYALCMKTSGLSELPHVITGVFEQDPRTQLGLIKKMSCTCKAGLSEECKHIVAVLLYCTQ